MASAPSASRILRRSWVPTAPGARPTPRSPQLAGLTLVLEGYILDGTAPNGLFWITPPVFTSFI